MTVGGVVKAVVVIESVPEIVVVLALTPYKFKRTNKNIFISDLMGCFGLVFLAVIFVLKYKVKRNFIALLADFKTVFYKIDILIANLLKIKNSF